MKTSRVVIALIIAFFTGAFFGIEVRLGIGQLYPRDEEFKTAPNQLFGEMGFSFVRSFSVGVGGRYIDFGKIDVIENPYSPIIVEELSREINGFGTYIYGKFEPKLGGEAKIAPFAQFTSGVHFTYPTAKMKYTSGTERRFAESKSPSETVPFAMLSAGIEFIFSVVGVFAQGSYIKSGMIDYKPFEIEGFGTVSPGGKVDPSGWQIYVGVSLH